jgi:hypothetical protein
MSTVPSAPKSLDLHAWRDAAVLLLLCGLIAYLRWLKMDSLMWADPARWLFEAQRLASGEMPYRDFSWQYPPFSIFLLGVAMRWFGATFTVAQVVIDLISMAVIVLAWLLVRRILPRFVHLPVMFFLLAVCATSLMNFNLFSFLTYVPSLQTGAAGLLLLLCAVLSYLRRGRLTSLGWAALALGAFVASYSKPESLLATCAILGVLALVDRHFWFAEKKTGTWFRHYTLVCAVCLAPALGAYLWTGAAAGFGNMKAGITGYGIAGSACPWWPTGLGIFGAAAALGEAAFIAAILSLTRRKQFAARFGRRYGFGLAAGVLGGALYLGYTFARNWDVLTSSRSFSEKFRYLGPSTVWTSPVLLPVMWTCVALWIVLLIRVAIHRQKKVDPGVFEILVLLTAPAVMSARGWFNSTLGVTSDVPGICYPFLMILGPYLIWRFLAAVGSGPDLKMGLRAWPAATLAAGLVAYGLLRIVGGYPDLLSDRSYQTLSTLAGKVKLRSYATDAEIYRYVLDHTAPSDALLDVPYGGGMNMATSHSSPLFETQFFWLSMPDSYLNQDLERIQRHPPQVVIAQNEPNFGAFYGLRGCSCVFPRLVWIPPTTSEINGKVFPSLEYIKQNYRVAKVIGAKQILTPARRGTSQTK